MSLRLRSLGNRLKTQHGILQNFKKCLTRVLKHDEAGKIKLIVPGVMTKIKSAKGSEVKFRINSSLQTAVSGISEVHNSASSGGFKGSAESKKEREERDVGFKGIAYSNNSRQEFFVLMNNEKVVRGQQDLDESRAVLETLLVEGGMISLHAEKKDSVKSKQTLLANLLDTDNR